MKSLVILFYVILCGAGLSWAKENTLTVYNSNLGLIKETRIAEIEKDRKTLIFTDVASEIIPESVTLRPLSGKKNFWAHTLRFQYDLASPERVLDKTLGKSIEILTENGDYIQGILLNRYHSSLLLQTDDGIKIIPKNDKLLMHINRLPEGLVTRPTLVWEAEGLKDGKQKYELSYLTEGLSWDAAYVGVLNDRSTSMELDTWAKIRNDSGAGYKDVWLKLIAAEVNRAQETGAMRRMAKRSGSMAAAAEYDSGAGFQQGDVFEYYVYALGKTISLNDKEVLRISLRPKAAVKTKRQYTYNHRRNVRGVGVRVLFENQKRNGLGEPLPSGIVRVYQKDNEDMVFLGEHRIKHTARNEEVKLPVGNAFDLSGERKVMESRRISDRSERQTVSIELRNNKKEDDVLIIVEETLSHRNWKIEDRSHEFTKKDVRQIEFATPVPADSKAVVKYTVLYSW